MTTTQQENNRVLSAIEPPSAEALNVPCVTFYRYKQGAEQQISGWTWADFAVFTVDTPERCRAAQEWIERHKEDVERVEVGGGIYCGFMFVYSK